ncbi:hypothetical protein EUX98_g9057 [Antrodiella citrinella]|uniref:BHLH domain-containing protein n=1 Tax=Antrodiella citrinella TaxID=2447956 RepID=A0A4S4M0Y3_9APHY|nr:hypothetical protein EUX98_g9057 [Antrodiella citrinella]
MTISVPASSSSPSSPLSTDDPHSPVAAPQTLALTPADGVASSQATRTAAPTAAASAAAAQAKRKPSRRANTAERRATHNAVERQRRETLNGRFLDLAALLPNLSQIRRPSKSSIVNSSIAHIHASRRHRLLAARELRLVKLEADALRREINEWRDRSGLPRVEEPVRGDAFHMIMSGEVEVINAGPIEEEGDEGDDYGNDYGNDDYPSGNVSGGHDEDIRMTTSGMIKNSPADVTPFAHNVSVPGSATNHLHLQTMLPRAHGHGIPSPVVVQSPSSVSYENPAMAASGGHIYDQPSMQHGGGQYYHASHVDKVNAWSNHVYGSMGHPQQQQQFTPPNSSHSGNASPPLQQAAYLMSLRQQQLMQGGGGQLPHQHHGGHMYGSPVDGDDESSVGSAPNGGNGNGGMGVQGDVRRARSGSMNSVGSGGSPGASVSGSYEMPSVLSNGGVQMARRMNSGMGAWDEGLGMNGMGMGMGSGMGQGMGMGGGMMKGPQAISVGGGGNAHGFAAMMM